MKGIIKLTICFIIFTIILMSTSCLAVWWGTPGYEWALSNNLTPARTRAQLNSDVKLEDYYSILLKYLKMKGVEPSGRVVQNLYVEGIYNGTINGLVSDINSQIGTDVKSLSPQKYRVVEDLILHGKQQIREYSYLLYRDDLKSLDLYFDLARYRAATLLSENSKIERQYKNDVLYKLRNTKYAESITYGILPMCESDISRQSFLVLIHHLMSNITESTDSILNSFHNSGVLIGYNDRYYLPKLRQNLNYVELFNFLYRLEAYDFDSSSSSSRTNTSSDTSDQISSTSQPSEE